MKFQTEGVFDIVGVLVYIKHLLFCLLCDLQLRL